MTQRKKIVLAVVAGFCLANSLFAAVEVKINSKEGAARKKEVPSTRAIADATLPAVAGLAFGKSAFSGGTGYFADTVGAHATNALVKAKLEGDATNGYQVQPKQLAINAELTNKQIDSLTLRNGQPTVVVHDKAQVTVVTNETTGAVAQSGFTKVPASLIHDAGDQPIIAQPAALATGKVAGEHLVFAAVRDKNPNQSVSPDWLADAAKGQVALTNEGVALVTQLSGGAAPAINKPIAKYVATVLKDNVGFKTAVANLVRDNATVAAGSVTIDATVDTAFTAPQSDAVATAAETVVSAGGPQAALKIVDEKVAVANAATVGTNVSVVGDVAAVVLANRFDQVAFAGDRDNVKTGAAAAIEGGVAWAARNAAVGGAAVVVQGLFKDGADAVTAAVPGANVLPKFAATVIPLEPGPAFAIKTAGAAAITKAAWADAGAENQGVNKRILAAADYAADPAKAEVLAAVTAATAKLAGDNTKTFFVSPTDFALRAAELAAATKAANAAPIIDVTGATGPVALVGAAGAGNVFKGANAALEAAFARAVGAFQLQNDSAADLKAATDSTVGAVKTKMTEVIGAGVGTVETLLTAVPMPIASLAARAVRENLSLRSEDLGQAYAVVADVVQPNDYATAATNRLKGAWTKALATETGAAFPIATIAAGVAGAGAQPATTAILVTDGDQAINSAIWNVAKSQTVEAAAAAAKKLVTADDTAHGNAAVIAAGLGWGLRVADVEAANTAIAGGKGQKLADATLDAMTKLNLTLGVGAKVAGDALIADAGFKNAVAAAAQNAIKDAVGGGAVNAAAGVIDRVETKGKPLAIELAKARQDAATPQTLPYIDPVIAGRVATVAATGDAAATRAALVAPLVAGLENTYPAGVTAALTAGLADAARNYKFAGTLFDDPVANAVDPWGHLVVAQAASDAATVKGFADAALAQLKTAAPAAKFANASPAINKFISADGIVAPVAVPAWNDLVQQAVTDARLIKAAIEADTAAKSTDATSVASMISALYAAPGAVPAADIITALNKVATIKQAASANNYSFIPTVAQIHALVPMDNLAKPTSAAHIGFDAYTSMADNARASGVAAALIATIGYGVRMAQLGDAAVNAWDEEKITQQIVTPMIKTMAEAVDKGGDITIPAAVAVAANAVAAATLTDLWDTGKESVIPAGANPTALAARHKIAQTILNAVKSGTDFAAQRAAFFANNGIFVNNIVANEFDHFGVSAQTLKAKLTADKLKIKDVAKAVNAATAATASQAVAVADQDVAAPNLLNPGVTTAGAAAVLHAAGGYGASQVTMATDPATIVATVLTGGGNKVLDELVGAAPGGYGADKTIAKAVAVELLADAAGTLDAAKTAIVAAVKAGTGTAAGHVIGRMKDNPVAEAAWAVNDPATVDVKKLADVVGVKDNGAGVIRVTDAASAAGLTAATAVDHILQPNGGGGVDIGNTKREGAAAAIEAGVAWALRKAPANAAVDVKALVAAGAAPVDAGLAAQALAQGAAQLVIADAETLGNPAGSIKAAAETMIKYDTTKWNDTNPPAVNKRIYEAADSVANSATPVAATVNHAGDVVAGPLKDTFNVARGDVVLDFGHRMRDAATQLNAGTIAAQFAGAADTVTQGNIVALEAGLALSGARLPVSDVIQGGAGGNGLLKFFNDATYNLNGDFGLNVAGKKIASTAAKAFIYDLNNDPGLLDTLYNTVKNAIVPVDNLPNDASNRVKKAWVDVGAAAANKANNDTIAGKVSPVGGGVGPIGGAIRDNIADLFDDQGKSFIWNVAKQESVQAAVDMAANLVTVNNAQCGAAAAIAAGLGWGIRNVVIGDFNDPVIAHATVKAKIKEAITALKTNATVVAAGNAAGAVITLESDPGGAEFLTKMAQVVQGAITGGAQKVATGLGIIVGNSRDRAQGLIEQLNPVAAVPVDQDSKLLLPYLDADRMQRSINQPDVAGVASAIAPAAVTKDDYAQGISAALEAALTWGARNFVLEGQLVNTGDGAYAHNNPLSVGGGGAAPIAVVGSAADPVAVLTRAIVDQIKDDAGPLAAVAKAKAGAAKVHDQLDDDPLKTKVFDILKDAATYARTKKIVADVLARVESGELDDSILALDGHIDAAIASKVKMFLNSKTAELFIAAGRGALADIANDAKNAMTDTAEAGYAAGILAAVAAGIRNVPYDAASVKPAWTTDEIDTKIVIPMTKAVIVADVGANVNAEAKLAAMWDTHGAGALGAIDVNALELRIIIASSIYDAIANYPAIATEKARVLANNAILVNNLVANPHFGVTPKLITDAINAGNKDVSLASERQIVKLAENDTARAVSLVARDLALADADYVKPGSITAAGASAAIQAAVGWGTHASLVDSTGAETKELITKVDSLGVFDVLKGGAVSGFDPLTHTIAKTVATQLAADAGVGGFLEKLAGTDAPPRVLGDIGNAVVAGTKAAAADLVGRLKVVSPVAEAAWLLKAPKDSTTAVLNVGPGANTSNARVRAAAATADTGAAAQAVTDVAAGAPVAGSDSVLNGALAAIEGETGWLIKAVNVDKVASILSYNSRPWKTTEVRDGKERGIAVLKPAANTLEVVGQAGGGTRAALVDLAAKAGGAAATAVAFTAAVPNPIDSACLGGDAPCMYWDDQLERLFVGLQGVKRGKANDPIVPPNPLNPGVVAAPDKQGGVVGVLVGTVAGRQVTFAPVIKEPTSVILDPAAAGVAGRGVVGFYSPARGTLNALDNTMQTSIWNLRTMHTSTGHDYLIVNGDTRAAGALDVDIAKSKAWVYALPVMPKGNVNAGQLAKKDFSAVASVAADLYTVRQGQDITNFSDDEKKAVVGRDPRLIGFKSVAEQTSAEFTSMEVVGDTVYVALAEARAVPDLGAGVRDAQKQKVEAGIFASTAIFDVNGFIANWTPWKRVGGTTDKVYGFGIEPSAATPLYLTGAQNTIKSSAWGKSEQVTAVAASRKLTAVLESDAVFGNNGFQLFNFDENTPGFGPGRFSMMVAVGPDRIALIETAKWDAVNFNLKPTTEFKVPAAGVVDPNVFVFKASDYRALRDIMPLTCADVLRKPLNLVETSGYLYIGGYRGLARMELSTAGNHGWPTNGIALGGAIAPANGLQGLAATTADTFPGGANWTFRKLDTWNGTCVVGMTGGSDSLQVLGLEKMTKIDAAGAVVGAANKALDGAMGQFGCDLVVAGDKMIAATTTGLLVAPTALDKDPVKVDATAIPAGQIPVQLAYISSDLTGNSAKGDLYVLTVNPTQAESKIYRLTVDAGAAALDGVVKPINGQDGKFPMTFSGADAISKFATDGSVMLTVRPMRQGVTNVVSVGVMRGNGVADITPLDNSKLSIDITSDENQNTQAAYIAAPVKDSATGAWVIPGDFGARVNE